MKTTTETYMVLVRYVLWNRTDEREFKTKVTIKSTDPYTDLQDIASERVHDSFPDDDIQILDIEETFVS